MSLRFDQPLFLLLAALAIPLLFFGWRALSLTDGLRRATILGLRAMLVVVFAVILAGPRMWKEHDHLTIIGVLDISGSVRRFADFPPLSEDAGQRRSNLQYLRDWFRSATQIKSPDDRFGLVVFDGKAIAALAPTRSQYVDDNLDVPIAPGTNIEDALRLARAMFPPDTGKRLALVTDGNETAGNVLEAIKRFNGGDIDEEISGAGAKARRSQQGVIPIDVLPIAYHIDRDVQVVRVEAPPTAQPGQTVTVRIVLESTAPVAGSLSLRREGQVADLNGGAAGNSRPLVLPAGQSVHVAQLTLGETPINRFEAVFEADDPTDNVLPDNDRAEAFTTTPGRGSVLVVDAEAGRRENGLATLLENAGIVAKAQSPLEFPEDLLSLQNYDLIVLDNIAAHELNTTQQELLARYVNDLGGGLIMTGGENSFGAGGWKGSPVAELLPVELDPSKELRLPTAALVLVLDKSGSMNHPVAGARATQQQIANEGAALAIESLRSENLVGVISFDLFAHTVVPLQPNVEPKKIANMVRAITAEGGTNLEAPLRQAYDMIKEAKVAKKRVVFLTDGRSGSDEGLEDLARMMAASDIQLTTIAVGDDADHEVLAKLAKVGGGSFYPVRDPRKLPRVLLDSVQIINKPLVKEISFVPRVLPTGSTLTIGMDAAPPLEGLIITSARNDAKVSLEMADPDGEPLLAHWQIGLGRVAAFTSAAPGANTWSRQWEDWPTSATFWTQLVRMISRPAMSQDAEIIVGINGDQLNIAFDMGPADASRATEATATMSYLQVGGMVYRPDGTTEAVRLRQTAPGRYEARADAELAGNYVVALSPRQGTRLLSPAIGGVNRTSNPEFRKYVSNLALLEEIVQQTGGRKLNVADPRAIGLFDRTGMAPSVSSLPAWRTILWWLLALLLLDVASRRLAWDSLVVGGFVRRVLERVTPARVRGAQAAATLATLRQVSEDVGTRRESRSVAVERLEATESEASLTDYRTAEQFDSKDDVADSRSEPKRGPDESMVADALNAFLGRAKQPPASKGDEAKPVDAGKMAVETTSNLLAAKRRAREQQQKKDQKSSG